MLISKTVEMSWNAKNKARYESLGYKYTKMRDKFIVRVEDLPRYSRTRVIAKCDYCGKEYDATWDSYISGHDGIIKKDCCSNPSCTGAKAKEVVYAKYGEQGLHSSEIEAKRKSTCLEKYGAYNVFGSEEIKEKIKETNIKKYGVPYNQQNPEIRKKTVETCREKYGVDNYIEVFKGKFIGENSPCWKGGAKHSRVERATHEYQEWRKSVFIKYHFTCAKCGKSGNIELHAHHIFNWKDNPDKRYDINNGIALCSDCHYKFHSIYGKSNNTEKQLKEFIELDEKLC